LKDRAPPLIHVKAGADAIAYNRDRRPMSFPAASFAPSVVVPRSAAAPVIAVLATEGAAFPADARRWLTLAVGSLLLAGLLSLSVVIGRLPWLSGLIDDPLFFKRSLVVHVDLALVVWFYAVVAALGALRTARRPATTDAFAFLAAVFGVVAMVAGGGVRGAAPILANYIPVIDHPLFLLGLAWFFAGTLTFIFRTLTAPSVRRPGGLPPDAAVGVQAAGVALAIALATWISARAALPAGLDRHTFFEFGFWGAGHALQVANVSAMLAVWLWLLHRASGRSLFSARGARVVFLLLLAPHFVMPLLSWQGALHRTYIEGSTQLMRWGLFPVVLVVLGLSIRHLLRHGLASGDPLARAARTGFAASAGLTLLGFVLGAMIRESTTLIPAHYHASLGGVTAAFMTAAFLAIAPLRGDLARLGRSARRQLACFGVGQAVFALGFAIGGIHGLARKAYAGEQHVRSLGEQVGLGVMGAGGLLAAVAGVGFLVLVLPPLLSRRRAPAGAVSQPVPASP
jgi:hypothetical protein